MNEHHESEELLCGKGHSHLNEVSSCRRDNILSISHLIEDQCQKYIKSSKIDIKKTDNPIKNGVNF